MTTEPAAPPRAAYAELERSPEFRTLRRSFRGFAFPITVSFVVWYLLYVLLSSYAGPFMRTTVVGHVNVAFVLGLLQFASTFAIASWYSRYAGRRLDPIADRMRAEAAGEDAA